MHPIEQSRQAILAYMQAQPPKSKVSSALENISNFAALSGVGGMLKAFASNAFSGQSNRQSAASPAQSEGSLLKNTFNEIAPVAESAIRQHPWPALAIAALAGAGLVMSKSAQRQVYRYALGSLGGSLAISSLLPKVLDLLQNRQK